MMSVLLCIAFCRSSFGTYLTSSSTEW